MTDLDIIKQLKELNRLKADSEWREKNRRFILSELQATEISGQPGETITEAVNRLSFARMRHVTQSVMAVIFIFVIIFGGTAIGIKAARNTKPGDSLYIAKIINEKTQLALTFNEKKKALLGLEFAGNRARELSQVLAGPQDDAKGDKVEQLVNDFKKEISAARERITKIETTDNSKQITDNRQQTINDQESIDTNENLPLTTDEVALNTETEEGESDQEFFSANLGKDETGIQLSEPSSPAGEETLSITAEEGDTSTPETVVSETPAEDASTTEEQLSETTPEEAAGTDPEILVNEAQTLLESQDYKASLEKLDQAGAVIDQVTGGEVKGENDAATTTPEIINNEIEGATTTLDK